MRPASKKRAVQTKYLVLVIISILIIVLDQFTKNWILKHFSLGETFQIVSDYFNITYVQNRGAAFGLLAQADPRFRVPFFIVVPLIALFSIGYVFRKIPETDSRLAFALSLVISGAVGNLIDRLALGFVVDFLDFHWRWGYHFPAFNVADSAICVGVGLLILDLFTNNESEKKGRHSHASRAH